MQSRTSAFGFVWDSTADRLADLAMIAGPVILVATQAAPGWGVAAVAAGTAAAGLLLLLEYVRARAQAGQVAAAWSLATPGERPTRVIVLGLAGLAVGAAQLGGDGLAAAALDLGYPAGPGRPGRARGGRLHPAPAGRPPRRVPAAVGSDRSGGTNARNPISSNRHAGIDQATK